MESKTLKNLCVFLGGDDIGSLSVNYDLSISYDVPADRHPDNLSAFLSEEREVKINSVGFVVFDKVEKDISDTMLTDKRLLSILESKVLSAIEGESVEDLTESELTILK